MKRPTAAQDSSKSVESNTDKAPSLMDQWKEHYNNRDFTTKPHHLHRMGLFTYFYCLLGVPSICAIFILPSMDLSLLQWLAITALSVFVMAENLLNFLACVRLHHDKDIVFCFHCSEASPSVAARSNNNNNSSSGDVPWVKCLKCQRDAPPRSHHCKVCGHCILRRGHHCYFICGCVGHHNQKHFLVLCLYSAIGIAIGSFFVAAGLTDSFQSPWRLLLPVTLWHWSAGQCGIGSIYLVLSLYVQLGCLGVCCVYEFLETVLVLRGQTFYEMGRGIQRYNLGVSENIRLALGSQCYRLPLLLLYPFDMAQSSDGVNWKVTKHQ